MAHVQLIPWGLDDAPSSSVTQYQSLGGNGEVATWTNTEAEVKLCIPTAGVLTNWWAKGSASPGVGKTNTLKVRLNGADSALSLAFSGTPDLYKSSQARVTVADGDLVDISSTPGSSPAAAMYYGALEFRPTDPVETVLLGATGDTSLGSTLRYLCPSACANGAVTESDVWTTIAEHTGGEYGLVKKFRVVLEVAPGVGKSRTFTVRQNAVATSMVVTISGTDTTGEDSTNTFYVNDGDTLSIAATSSGSPASSKAYYGFVLEPNRVGDYLICGVSGSALSTTGAAYEYNLVGTGAANWTTSKTDKAMGGYYNHFLTSVGMKLSRAPNTGGGSGKSYEMYIENPSAGGIRAHVVDAATYNNSGEFCWGLRTWQTFNPRTLAFGTPSSASASWALQMRCLKG